MNIHSISKGNNNTIIELNANELSILCDVLYSGIDSYGKYKGEIYFQLYGDMMMARDLCKYGKIDGLCLSSIVKCRENVGGGVDGVLSDEDIDIFNSYLEDNDMSVAFGNSDFVKIYNKIVGSHGYFKRGDKIKRWMDSDDE